MIKDIVFSKVNNFWIDNGIVGLFKVLEHIKENVIITDDSENIIEYEITLSADNLKIELTSNLVEDVESNEIDGNLIKILNEARNYLSDAYVSISTKKCRWFYKEKENEFVLFDKTSYKTHLRGTFFNAKPEYEGILYSPNTLKKEILDGNPKKLNMSNLVFEKFKEFKDSNKEIFEKKIDSKERNEGFLNKPSKYTFGRMFSNDFVAKGSKICAFSGSKVKNTIEVNGMYSPIMTSSAGEINFASFLQKKPQISLLNSFIAVFAPYNLYYSLKIEDKKEIKNYFVLYDNNLKELSNFYNVIQMDLSTLRNQGYCNFTNLMYNLELEAETLFDFIISIYQQVKGKLSKDERKGIYGKSIFTFTNDGNIFRDVKEYTSLATMFDFFDAFNESQDETLKFEQFLNLVRFFTKKMKTSKGDQYDTTWRNRLCSDLLHFRSIAKTIEWYFGEVKIKDKEPSSIYNLDKIISIYNNKTQFNMKSEMVEMCKSIGNRIGRHCRESDNKGILFSIRNAKNRVEFLNVLAESQFRTEVSYGEDFFKSLPDTPQWEEYKALVSIFAMNSFLYKPDNKSTN
jgi:hypothetical protein